jgi:hypothetical protein
MSFDGSCFNRKNISPFKLRRSSSRALKCPQPKREDLHPSYQVEFWIPHLQRTVNWQIPIRRCGPQLSITRTCLQVPCQTTVPRKCLNRSVHF